MIKTGVIGSSYIYICFLFFFSTTFRFQQLFVSNTIFCMEKLLFIQPLSTKRKVVFAKKVVANEKLCSQKKFSQTKSCAVKKKLLQTKRFCKLKVVLQKKLRFCKQKVVLHTKSCGGNANLNFWLGLDTHGRYNILSVVVVPGADVLKVQSVKIFDKFNPVICWQQFNELFLRSSCLKRWNDARSRLLMTAIQL